MGQSFKQWCWHCGAEYGADLPRCSECGRANRDVLLFWVGIVASVVLICTDSADVQVIGALGITFLPILIIVRAARAIKLHKQWRMKTIKKRRTPPKAKPKAARKTPRPMPRIDHSVGPIDFDITPDRTIDIDYCDAAGTKTRRTVTAQRIHSEQGGELYLVGFCHLRNRMRSFRFNRIRIIYENGTEITPTDFLAAIGLYSDRGVKESIAIKKMHGIVKNMTDADLDGFVEKF